MKKALQTLFSLAVLFSLSTRSYGQCNQTICNGPVTPGLCAENACVFCNPCVLNNYSFSSFNFSNQCDWPGPFCGTIENNQWYAFLSPPTGTISFTFNVTNCVNGQGIQAEIYSTDDCNNFTSVSNCSSLGVMSNFTVTANGLAPYCTYYLMIDGFAGDVCDFVITTSTCNTPPPPVPININGPSPVCPNLVAQYCVDNPPAGGCGNNSNVTTWTITPPQMGVIIGPTDQPCITVQWLLPGQAVLNYSSNNVCFGASNAFPKTVVITAPVPHPETHPVCLGECVPCAGIVFCAPGIYPVTLTTSQGCDSIVNCIITPLTPVIKDLGLITICAPQKYTSCGQEYDKCGVYSATCDNWQGCDSTNIFDLAILDPKAKIAPPGVLPCSAGATMTLDGSGSAAPCLASVSAAYSWTGPPGGISGSSTGQNVTITKPGQYCLTVTHSRGGVTCSNTQCVTVLQNNDTPQTPQISGPTSLCPGESAQYTVTPVGNLTPTGYTWTTSNGAAVTQVNSTTVSVTWTTPGSICVTADGACGSSSQACLNVGFASTPTASISGSGQVCPGSGTNVNLTITLTGTPPWTVGYNVNGGAPVVLPPINASPYTLTANQIGTYTLTSVIGGAGCTGTTSGSASISEYTPPTAALSGTGSVCQGSGQTTPLTINLTGNGPWTVNWQVGANAQAPLDITGSPYTLNLGQAQAGNITLTGVTDNNGCTGTVSGSGTVTVNTAPTVSNIQTPCDPTNTTYTVSFTINGGNPGSYTVNGAPSGNSFTSNPIPSGSTYNFVITDANNCNPVTLSDAVLCNCTTDAGDMDLKAIEECGDGPVVAVHDGQQVFDGDDVLVFILHSGSGNSIQNPVIGTFQTPSVSFDPGKMTYGTTYYLSAVAGNDNGSGSVDLSDPCKDISQGTPIVFHEIPSAELKDDPVICEGENAKFTVNLTGTGPWSITYDAGVGPQQINGITNNPYTLTTTPATSGVVVLTGMSDSNCPGNATGSGNVTMNTEVLVSPYTIACNATGTAYTVTFSISGGDPSSYFVEPPNGTLSGGTFTSNLIPDTMGFIFTVDDANGCDPKVVQQTEVDCSCTTEVGTMDVDAVDQCGTAAITATYDPSNQVLDGDDVQVFILHTNPGTNPGTIIATSNTPTFAFDPAKMSYGVTYYISAIVGNPNGMGGVDLSDPCYKLAPGKPVTFYEIPTAVLSALSPTSICLGDSVELEVKLTGSIPWQFTLDGQPFSNITIADVPYTVSPQTATTYTLSGFSDGNCPGTISGSVAVEVNTAPVVTSHTPSCDADTNTYSVVVQISGGDPASYSVTPPNGTLTGSTFTANFIPSNQQYQFIIDDKNHCAPDTVNGTLDCNCVTMVDGMSANQFAKCVNEGIGVPPVQTKILDADDVLLYYLHSDPNDPVGSVITTNTQPGFNFNPNTMMAGTVYYVSAVAGNNNGSGGIDHSDFCLSIAGATPILFHALPTVNLVGNDAVCEGQDAKVTFTMNGTGPFNISYRLNGVAKSALNVTSPHTLTFTPNSTSVVQMIAITDLGTGCSSPSGVGDTILFFNTVTAGVVIDTFRDCDINNVPLSLPTLLSGADPGGVWTNAAGNTIPNGLVNTGPLTPGTYTFTYTVGGTPPCPDDQENVQVIIHPQPVADAGADHIVDCDVDEVTLGGNNNTPGVTYAWTGSVSDPAIAKPTTKEPGTYTLVVTNQFGCTDDDVVSVTQQITEPIPYIRFSAVSCFGKKDGSITIDSITNGQAPYLISFNGGAFGTKKQFTDLAPGDYTIVIQDANGCEVTVEAKVAEPEEVIVDLVVNIEGQDSIVELGDSVKLTVVVNPPFDSLDAVIWSPPGLIPCDTCETNWIAPTRQTTITIEVDKSGCKDDDKVTIYVKKTRPVYVPNAFSPNGDGTNDEFYIFAGNSVTKIKSFLVFNRWGESVYEYYNFEPNNPAFGWKGDHRGEPMDPGVFTWFAEIEFIDGKSDIYEGDVILMK
jgi:gliding motility-associated-like protein